MQTSKTKALRTIAMAGFAIVGLTATWSIRTQASDKSAGAASQSGASTLLDLPLSFEPNRGQSEAGVLFVARGPGYTLRLNDDGPSFDFSPSAAASPTQSNRAFALRLAVIRKSPSHLRALDEQPSKSSYFTGTDPKKWLTGIPNFARVERRNVYEGIDISYRGLQGQLECQFTVAPNAAPGDIKLQIVGARRLHIDPKGDAIFSVANMELRLRRLDAHQEINGSSQSVPLHYEVRKNVIAFRLGTYDRGKNLFIKPVLSYSDFSGAPANASAPEITPKSTYHPAVSKSNLSNSNGDF